MNREEPSFYAIIPATVRYAKSLKPNAKLLYGEITALCNQEGYCWASNSYFADLYDVQRSAVSNWIKALSDAGFIRIEYVYAKGKPNIEKRKIYLTEPLAEEQPAAKQKEDTEAESSGGGHIYDQGGQIYDQGVVTKADGGGHKSRKRILQANNKKAAAADPSPQKIEKPPEKAAAENLQGETQKPPEISKQDVKKLNYHLLHLDSTLEHFDDEFYLKVLGFLDGHNLGLDYVTWFYKYICRERKLRSVRDYFFKVFLNTRYIGLFREETKPKPARTVAMTACPSCSLEHEAASQYCPQCSLSKDRRNDTGEIMFRRKLFGLDGKTREDYDSEYFLIIGNSNSIPEKSKQIAVLNHKYGLL